MSEPSVPGPRGGGGRRQARLHRERSSVPGGSAAAPAAAGHPAPGAAAEPAPPSARLHFRRARAADVEALVRHWSAPAVRRYLWDDAPVPAATVRAVLAASDADFARAGYGLWVLERGDGSLAGTCGLRRVDGTPHVEVLYSIEPALWGGGLATEAARACLRFAFEHLELPRVLGGVDAPNVASRRVLEKLGMTPFDAQGAAPGVAYLAIDAARYFGLSGVAGPGV